MSTGQVIHLESVDSTNEYLKRQGALLPDGTVVVADHQTAGKGRLGRSWQDAPGQSLLASWLLKSLQGDALLLLTELDEREYTAAAGGGDGGAGRAGQPGGAGRKS